MGAQDAVDEAARAALTPHVHERIVFLELNLAAVIVVTYTLQIRTFVLQFDLPKLDTPQRKLP